MPDSSLICSQHLRSICGVLVVVLLAAASCGEDPPPVTPPTADTATGDADADIDAEPDEDVQDEPDATEEIDVFVPCEEDDACDEGLYCDIESGDCLNGCRAGDRPGAGSCEASCHSCDIETRTCVENHTLPGCEPGCEDNSACDDGTWCDPETERCLVGCRLEAEECPNADISHCCGSDSFCSEEHTCVAYACTADDECSNLEFCFSEEGEEEAAECRSGCRVDDPDTPENEDDCATAWGNEPDWVCNDELRYCERLLCDPHNDLCPVGYVCDIDRCRPGCRSNADCSEDQPCDLTTRSCRCESDFSCAGLEDLVCVDEHCVASCDRNVDCELFDLPMCNPENGRCVDCECFDEADIDDGDTVAPSSESLFFGVLCGADIDRYRVVGNAGETLNVLVTPDRGEITVQLHDSPNWDGLPLVEHHETIDGPGQFLQIAYPVTVDGTYYISIFGAGITDDQGCSQVGYNTRVERYPSHECRPDEYEENNSFGQSRRLEDGPTRGLTLCADDTDYWIFDVAPDERVEITLFIAEAGENLDLILYDETRSEVDRVDSGEQTELIFAGPTSEESTWYVAVRGHSSSDESGYELYRTDSRFGSCPDDDLEPDNERESATFAESGESFDGLTACQDDEDWFVTQGITGGDLRVSFEQSSAACTLRLTLFAPSGEALQTVENSHPSKELEVEGLLDSGSYAVQVTNLDCLDGADVEGVDYDIDFQFATPRCTDGFEENDVSDDATSILSGSSTFDSGDDAVLCVEDVDYYRFEVRRDATLNVTVNPVLFASSFGLDLLRETDGGELELVKQCIRGSECVRTASAVSIVDERMTAGFYYLRVRQTGFIPVLGGATYQLTARLALDDVECIDEGREPNNGFEFSWAVLPETLCDAESPDDPAYFCERLCPEDNDHWWVSLGGPTHVEVDVRFEDGASGAVRLYELPPDGDEDDLVLRDNQNGSGIVEGDFLTGQAVIIEIDSNESTEELGDAYGFDVILSSVDVCQPSSNSESGFAQSLVLDRTTTGKVCDGHELWYILPVDDERVFSFTLDNTGATADLELTLYQLDGEDLVWIAQDSTSDSSTVIVRSSAWEGMALLKVEPEATAPINGLPFTLLATSEVVTECRDRLEPNESAEQAVYIAGDVDVPLSLCEADDDWFAFDVIGTKDVTVSIHQSDTSAPLTLVILNSEGETVAGPVTDTNADKTLAMADLIGGVYSVHVSGSDGIPVAGIAYSLSVEIGRLECTDSLEDNDTIETASDFLGAESGFLNLTACEGDSDVFEVIVGEGPASLDLSVSRVAPSVSMRLEFLEDDGTEISSQTGSGALISLSETELDPGTFYVRVTATDPSELGENYSLSIVVDEPFDCTDQYEGEGGNDTPATATVLGESTASLAALACEDADVYKIEVPLGPVAITASLTPIDPGPFTITLLDGAEEELGDDGSEVSLNSLAAGTYYVQVTTTAAPKRGRAYVLSISSESDGCVLDPFEPNDSIGEGLPLIPERSDSRAQVLCPGDVDVYRVVNTVEGQNLSVSIQHSPGDNPVRVVVLDGDGVLVAENSFVEGSLGFMGFWTFNLPVATYYVWVSASVGDDGLRYKLWHTLSDDSPCIDDGFEPNDTKSEPFALSSGAHGANLCPAQSDWYSQEIVSTDGEIYIGLSSESGASFQVDLYEADGSTAVAGCTGSDVTGSSGAWTCDGALSDTSDSGEGVTLFAPELSPGTYLIQVSADGVIDSEGADYQLTIEREERGCINDTSEPNESFAGASVPSDRSGDPLPFDGTVGEFRICQDEQDYLTLETTTGLLVTIEGATGNPTELVACLHTSDETELRYVTVSGDTPPGQLAVSNSTEDAYTYYLRVSSEEDVGSIGLPYQLAIEELPLCENDEFEGGPDSFDDPIDGDVALRRDVESGEPNAFRLCPGDRDIFQLQTSVGPVVTCDPDSGDPDCFRCEEDSEPPCGPGLGIKFLDESWDLATEASLAQRAARFRVAIYDSDSEVLAQINDTRFMPMKLAVGAYPSETVYYVVASLDEEFGEPVDYTLLASAAPMCVSERDNHEIEDAVELVLDEEDVCSNRCPDNSDFYSVTVDDGILRLIITGDDLSNLSVRVLQDGDVVPAVEMASFQVDEIVMEGYVEAGTYDFQLEGGDTTDYCMRVSQDECFIDPSDVPEGANDTRGTAYEINWQGGAFAMCPTGTDEDWLAYTVPPPRGGDWNLSFDFEPSSTDPLPDFVFEIVDSDGTVLATVTDETAVVENKRIRTPEINAGSDERTIYVHIASDADQPFEYQFAPIPRCPSCL